MNQEHQINPQVCKILGLPKSDHAKTLPTSQQPELCDRCLKFHDIRDVTLSQYKEAVRVKIAELEDWTFFEIDETWLPPKLKSSGDGFRDEDGVWHYIPPDYPNDLNACHAMIQDCDKDYCFDLDDRLTKRAANEGCAVVNLTALHWCEEIILMEAK